MPVVTLEAVRDGISLLTLNRPESLNAMNHELVAAVHDALDEVDNDQSCRVVVLTGAGRAFCAGLDLKGSGTAPGTEGIGRAQAGSSRSSTSRRCTRICAASGSRSSRR